MCRWVFDQNFKGASKDIFGYSSLGCTLLSNILSWKFQSPQQFWSLISLPSAQQDCCSLFDSPSLGWSVQSASGTKLGGSELTSCFFLSSRITARYYLWIMPENRYLIHFSQFKTYLQWNNVLYQLLNYAWDWNSFIDFFLFSLSKVFQHCFYWRKNSDTESYIHLFSLFALLKHYILSM